MSNNVQLGKSDLYVNPVGPLEPMRLDGHNLYPNLSEEQGKDTVRQAIESGVNFLDTAFMIWNGPI